MAVCSLLWGANHWGAAEIIRPKVLVIATYETGKDRGDVPGELQYWAERQKLDTAVPVPGLDHPLLTNGSGLYAMVSGTTSRCAVQIMALAMNPAIDLTHTYILLSGIGGADPATVTVGSAVWVRQVIDGDPAFEIDSREIPAAWPYGTIALVEWERSFTISILHWSIGLIPSPKTCTSRIRQSSKPAAHASPAMPSRSNLLR
jgi:purine nucleoside permease